MKIKVEIVMGFLSSWKTSFIHVSIINVGQPLDFILIGSFVSAIIQICIARDRFMKSISREYLLIIPITAFIMSKLIF